MAEIFRRNDNRLIIEMDDREAAYVLACLGNASEVLFPSLGNGSNSLYRQMAEAMQVPSLAEVPDEQADSTTRLFRDFSATLDAWCGKRNYTRARKLAAELGL